MPVAAARTISLTAAERHRLKKAAHGHKTAHQDRVRAQIVLHAARGRGNARIARETGVHLDTVRTWRVRFAEGGLPALADRKRPGRPGRFTPRRSPRSRRRPANCPPRPAPRCHAGRARNWRARSSPEPSPARSPPPRCGAG
ncbi:helix-turn-helix domain-containing protein [Streptomyces sp. NPDC048496]|uniref:helix-turn-helix domain-containing protein n=1 Tax=Streptomyces sp. NPDC048496 TaxID=3365558 RepID=UPI0037236B85